MARPTRGKRKDEKVRRKGWEGCRDAEGELGRTNQSLDVFTKIIFFIGQTPWTPKVVSAGPTICVDLPKMRLEMAGAHSLTSNFWTPEVHVVVQGSKTKPSETMPRKRLKTMFFKCGVLCTLRRILYVVQGERQEEMREKAMMREDGGLEIRE